MGIIFLILAIILIGYALYYIFISSMFYFGILFIALPGAYALGLLYLMNKFRRDRWAIIGMAALLIISLKFYYSWVIKYLDNLDKPAEVVADVNGPERSLTGCQGPDLCYEFGERYWKTIENAKKACADAFDGKGGTVVARCDFGNAKGVCKLNQVTANDPKLKHDFEHRWVIYQGKSNQLKAKQTCTRLGGKWTNL